jgi:hypothetical protein
MVLGVKADGFCVVSDGILKVFLSEGFVSETVPRSKVH